MTKGQGDLTPVPPSDCTPRNTSRRSGGRHSLSHCNHAAQRPQQQSWGQKVEAGGRSCPMAESMRAWPSTQPREEQWAPHAQQESDWKHAHERTQEGTHRTASLPWDVRKRRLRRGTEGISRHRGPGTRGGKSLLTRMASSGGDKPVLGPDDGSGHTGL